MSRESFDRRWYVYASWVAFIPLVFVGAAVRGLSGAAATALMLALSLSMAIAGVWGLVGYYFDAKASEETGYRPLWWAWALGHIMLSPIITSPLYLLRRTWKTGFPPRIAAVLGE